MTQSKSLIFVGDILPVRAPYRPPTRSLVGNFEGVLSKDAPETHKAYTSAVDPRALDRALMEKCLALSVANNHAGDAGPEAFQRTVRAIQSAGAIAYGHRENPVAVLKVGKFSVGILGCLEACRSRGPELVAEEDVLGMIPSLKARFDYLFITPHWGKESEFTPFAGPRTIRLAERWIEAGASGVFGHHPHAIQGFSLYRGRPIYPSLGNFSFSHPQCDLYPVTRLGLGVEISFRGKSMRRLNRYYFDRKPLKADKKAGKYFEDLSNLNYTSFSWMRMMGKTYITKSLDSWKLRLERGFSMEPLKFLVWLFLPKTLLMVLMSFFEKTKVLNALNKQYQGIGS